MQKDCCEHGPSRVFKRTSILAHALHKIYVYFIQLKFMINKYLQIYKLCNK